jgi:hypothetical protein
MSKQIKTTKTAQNRARRHRQKVRKERRVGNNKLTNETMNYIGSNKKFINLKKTNISMCTRMYTRALTNPWGDFSELPCIPDALIVPSKKVKTTSRGTMSTGTTGVGWIVVDPFLMVEQGGTLTSQFVSYPVLATNINYNTTSYYPFTTSALQPGVFAPTVNSEFASGYLESNPQMQLRLVGAGVKVRYVGNTLYDQGQITIYRSPGNWEIAGGSTSSTLLQDFRTSRDALRKGPWYYVTYCPDDPNYLGYKPYYWYNPIVDTVGNGSYATHRSLMLYIDGASTSTTAPFEFEVDCYYEVIGPNLTVSPSHSDMQAAATAQASLPVQLPTENPTKVESNVLKQIANSLANIVSSVGPQLINAGMKYAGTKALEAISGDVGMASLALI